MDEGDRLLAGEALRKQQAGRKPSRVEAAALRRVQKARDEEARWRHYKSIPKRDWQSMSGRAVKVLNEQADRYGIPLRGAEISLPDVARWLHDFLARNARRLQTGDDDELLAGPSSPALERYREERAKLVRLERLEREGELLARVDVHDALLQLADLLRELGEQLQRQYGGGAQELVDDTLDSFLTILRRWLETDADVNGNKKVNKKTR